jgi:DNA repair exonuclease SbcCD ATPase subunit
MVSPDIATALCEICGYVVEDMSILKFSDGTHSTEKSIIIVRSSPGSYSQNGSPARDLVGYHSNDLNLDLLRQRLDQLSPISGVNSSKMKNANHFLSPEMIFHDLQMKTISLQNEIATLQESLTACNKAKEKLLEENECLKIVGQSDDVCCNLRQTHNSDYGFTQNQTRSHFTLPALETTSGPAVDSASHLANEIDRAEAAYSVMDSALGRGTGAGAALRAEHTTELRGAVKMVEAQYAEELESALTACHRLESSLLHVAAAAATITAELAAARTKGAAAETARDEAAGLRAAVSRADIERAALLREAEQAGHRFAEELGRAEAACGVLEDGLPRAAAAAAAAAALRADLARARAEAEALRAGLGRAEGEARGALEEREREAALAREEVATARRMAAFHKVTRAHHRMSQAEG